MQIISIETKRQQRNEDKIQRQAAQVFADRARRLYPDVIMTALQLDDAAEALAILEQLAGTASTLQMLARKCTRREERRL